MSILPEIFHHFLLPQPILVLEISWCASESVSTAWTPETHPIEKDFTDLATLLTSRISSYAYWFLSFMPNTDTFARHKLSIPPLIFLPNINTHYMLIIYFRNSLATKNLRVIRL